MRQFAATIEKVTPFLFNRYVEDYDVVAAIGKKPADQTKLDTWRRAEADLRVYRNGQGPFLPSRNIRSAMVEGCKAADLKHKPQRGRLVNLSPFIRRGLSVEPMELLFGKIKMSLHDDMVRIPPRTGALVKKYWPKVDDWKLDFTLVVYDDSIQEEAELQEALHAAGLYCGLGTGRPDFGKFKLTSFKQV